MSRILVTGATGFIGSALIRTFAARGHALRAALRQPPPHVFQAVDDVFQHGDLAQTVDWEPALDGIDAVIHLAGVAHAGPGIAAARYDRVNRLATERLANAAAKRGVRRFVFVSSLRAQCGPTADHVLTERDTPTPSDAYGRSKLAAEAAVRAAGVPFTILRPVVLYGPGVKGNVALLARIAALPWWLPLKDFANRRSLLGIDNFISAVEFVLSSPDAVSETYIVADPGLAPSLSELIATLRQAQGHAPKLLPFPPSCIEAPLRLMGRGSLWNRLGGAQEASADKLVAAGWKPAHDTQSGLASMVRTLGSSK
jgi:UDP-glucose 4-epimerase